MTYWPSSHTKHKKQTCICHAMQVDPQMFRMIFLFLNISPPKKASRAYQIFSVAPTTSRPWNEMCGKHRTAHTYTHQCNVQGLAMLRPTTYVVCPDYWQINTVNYTVYETKSRQHLLNRKTISYCFCCCWVILWDVRIERPERNCRWWCTPGYWSF